MFAIYASITTTFRRPRTELRHRSRTGLWADRPKRRRQNDDDATVLGLLEPTYGEIEVGGINVRENPEEGCKLIGFMPDFPPVYEGPGGLGVSRPVRGQLLRAAGNGPM